MKFIKPTDPRVFSKEHSKWIRENFLIEAIEQIDNDPSAYFILKLKEAHSPESKEFRIIVKHKNFFREHFANYNDAMAVINRVKEAAYGR